MYIYVVQYSKKWSTLNINTIQRKYRRDVGIYTSVHKMFAPLNINSRLDPFIPIHINCASYIVHRVRNDCPLFSGSAAQNATPPFNPIPPQIPIRLSSSYARLFGN